MHALVEMGELVWCCAVCGFIGVALGWLLGYRDSR